MTFNPRLENLPFSRFIVEENSMLPKYKSGDHVLTFNWGRVKSGDVFVFIKDKVNYIKRVDKIEDDFVYLSGDNKEKASKIWKIEKSKIIGKVVLKY